MTPTVHRLAPQASILHLEWLSPGVHGLTTSDSRWILMNEMMNEEEISNEPCTRCHMLSDRCLVKRNNYVVYSTV